jgi:hypothetical protein
MSRHARTRALRAALIVSGLSTLGCGGTAVLEPRETADSRTEGSQTSGSSTGTSTGASTETSTGTGTGTQTTNETCSLNAHPTTERCCDEIGGGWDAQRGVC